jgi:hypothetical protein
MQKSFFVSFFKKLYPPYLLGLLLPEERKWEEEGNGKHWKRYGKIEYYSKNVNDATAMEIWPLLRKLNRITIWSTNFISAHISKRMESKILNRYLYIQAGS